MKLVLLHGLGADSRAFQRFVRVLPDRWNKQPVDLLGHGHAPKPGTGYSLDEHAAYIASVIAEAMDDDEPPVVLGHSLGAAVAIATAALNPPVVRALVLLDPARAGGGDERGADTQRMIQARREGRVRETVDDLYADQSRPLRDWIVETWEGMAQGVVDELETNWPRFLPSVRCPATIIHGDTEHGATGEPAIQLYPQARTMRIPGAGHLLHATHPRETAAAVVEAVDQMLGVKR